MNNQLSTFKEYLTKTRSLSKNSLLAYSRDVKDFVFFVEKKGVSNHIDISNSDIVAYLYQLKKEGKSEATINRKLASIRAYFAFLKKKKGLDENPSLDIKVPKVRKKPIEYLTTDEIIRLLDYPDKSLKGVRDKALLEVLYASGMRVSEAAGIDLSSLNFHIGFVIIDEKLGKARVIPLGRPARLALEKYVFETREFLIKDDVKKEKAVFLNMLGERLTRQGIWKIIKENAKQAGIKKKITPRILRNTFAVHLVQNGADVRTLQELLGHEDMSATEIYMEFSKNRIKDVYDNAHPRA